MNDDLSEVSQQQYDISAVKLSIEERSQNDEYDQMRNRQMQELIKSELSKNSNLTQSSTVRRLIETLKSQHITSQAQSPKLQKDLATSNYQLNSNLTLQIQSSRNQKTKKISKLITLRKDAIQAIQKTNKQAEQNNLKQRFQSLIDDIYSARSAKAFFSQPHYKKTGTNHDYKNSNTLKLQTKANPQSFDESGVKYISIPCSYKTIQSSRTSSLNPAYHKKASPKHKDQINKLEAEKAYVNTIWQLGINKKTDLDKKNLYHTIDPNQTEKWFGIARNSDKKLTQLFKDKNKLSEEQKYKTQKSRKNEYVQKLLEKSSQAYEKFSNQVKQITQAKDKSRSLILRNRSQADTFEYKVKQKQYFKINITKDSPKIKKGQEPSDSLNHILPQIKVNVGKIQL